MYWLYCREDSGWTLACFETLAEAGIRLDKLNDQDRASAILIRGWQMPIVEGK